MGEEGRGCLTTSTAVASRGRAKIGMRRVCCWMRSSDVGMAELGEVDEVELGDVEGGCAEASPVELAQGAMTDRCGCCVV